MTRKSEKKESPNTIHIDWQAECQKEADRKHATVAWCLTSSSGYVDDGQVFIFSTDEAKKAQVDAIVAGKSRDYSTPPKYESLVEKSRSVAGDEWTKLAKILEASRLLKNYDSKAFDGIQYRFREIRYKKDSKKPIINIIDMNNPQIAPEKETPEEAKNRQGLLDLISTLKKASQ